MIPSKADLVRRQAEFLDAHRRWIMGRPSYRIGRLLTAPLSFLFPKEASSQKRLPALGTRPKASFELRSGQSSATLELDLLASTPELNHVAILILSFDRNDDTTDQVLELCGSYKTPKGESFIYVDPDQLGRFNVTIPIPPGCRRLNVELRPWRTNSSVFVKDLSVRHRPPELVRYQAEGASRPHRVALYGDLDINIVDGSSIWLASIAKALAETDRVVVDLYLKRKPIRQTVVGPLLGDPRITIRCLDQDLLVPAALMEYMREQDALRRYDLLVLRGFHANALMAQYSWAEGRLCPYITDLPAVDSQHRGPSSRLLKQIIRSAKYLLCQTEHISSYYERHDPAARGKSMVVPPMVPNDVPRVQHGFNRANVRIVYAGKFARLWAIEEMLDSFAQLRRSLPDAELHIFGDKFHHDPQDPGFVERVRERFRSDQGVVWYGGVPREYVLQRLSEMDLAWAWRSPELEETTRELSTKILEYASASLPVVLYGNGTNRELLGNDYPLYAETAADASDVLERLASDRSALARASCRISQATSEYGFEAASRRLARLLNAG